jgi:SpoVK/Ycf46/Vps4 family AAA+-type ATPase
VKPAPVPDLELLIRSSHPLLVVDTDEEERATALVEDAVARLSLMHFRWNAAVGLRRVGEAMPIYQTSKLDACLDHISSSGAQGAVYQLEGAVGLFDEPDRVAKLLALAEPLSRIHSTIVLIGPAAQLPERVKKRVTCLKLEPPSDKEYYQFVNAIMADLRKRVPVSMELDAEGAAQLISHLRGLTFFEARKVLTRAIVRDGKLDRADFEEILKEKRAIVETSGVLEYFAAQEELDDIAGLAALKRWLGLRGAAFRDPARAREFGLAPPRGLLLLGVQGCGKSMCAKATAKSLGLPLLRLDPARLYDKYLGESEKNLRKAMELAERLAPIVLWIDELEKVFGGQRGSDDSGAAQRVLGSFLTWLSEKQSSVFVVATSNDITGLPPELLRKGRFDEIFFVDLPDHDVRTDIFALALARRQRDPGTFDLDALAALTAGFSGAELEQVVVASLYTAFGEGVDLGEGHLRDEIARTRPLSVTMAEPIAQLRAWAATRTTRAD